MAGAPTTQPSPVSTTPRPAPGGSARRRHEARVRALGKPPGCLPTHARASAVAPPAAHTAQHPPARARRRKGSVIACAEQQLGTRPGARALPPARAPRKRLQEGKRARVALRAPLAASRATALHRAPNGPKNITHERSTRRNAEWDARGGGGELQRDARERARRNFVFSSRRVRECGIHERSHAAPVPPARSGVCSRPLL